MPLTPSAPIDSTWKLTFDDEFNTLETNHWGTNWFGAPGAITKPINTYEQAAYDPNQVSVSDGYLHLKTANKTVTVGGQTYNMVTGMVGSDGHFEQTYGYFEARIYLPGLAGKISNWPAFFLDGQTWPKDGELDVMEGLSGKAGWHFHSPAGGPGDTSSADFTGWHVYGALWEPGAVTYYYDGVEVGKITTGITSSPMYLILNYGVSDVIGGPTAVPSEMLVDYVHVYSQDPNAVAVTPEANYGGPGDVAGDVVPPPPTPTADPPPTPPTAPPPAPANQALSGTTGNDSIVGGAGNDTLDGSAGSDTLSGGAGNDAYDVSSSADRIREAAGAGIDTVHSSINYTLGANVENLVLVGAATIGTGNTLDNVITGNDGGDKLSGLGGNDSLFGGAGNDTLDGGTGNDTMAGGAGNDTYIFGAASDVAIENPGGGIDTVQASFTVDLNTPASANIENVTLLGTAALGATGTGAANVLIGNNGANLLIGGGGSDTLIGGVGADTLAGGGGNDLYVVDRKTDVLDESTGDGTDTVQSSISVSLIENGTTVRGAFENLILAGTRNINGTGNDLDNAIVGNSGANKLIGNGGDDALDGGRGNDILTGGSGSDVFVRHDLSTEGSDTITDFQAGRGGDKLDLHDLISGFVSGTSDPNDFVHLVESGGNTTVQVDPNGFTDANHAFTNAIVLTGVTGLNVTQLVSDGNLELT